MNPTSPQMAQALRHLSSWAPAVWVRNAEDGQWRPERYSIEPPQIGAATMHTLIKRGRVRVMSRTPRGAPEQVELA